MVKKAVKKKTKKREKKTIQNGIVNIKSTFNNTVVSISDMEGNVVTWASGGTVGFKGSRKGTSFAAQVAAQDAARKAVDMGLQNAEVHIKGPGSGRESAMRALESSGIRISVIKDTTPIPHNGCRPRKKRRV